MNPAAVALCVLCQLFLVGGQLLLKRGMSAVDRVPRVWSRVIANIGAGIAAQTVWFFLWLGLLSTWDLSRIFPFEGLNPAIMVLSARVFLKERLTPGAWLGIGLICAGVVLVSGS